MTRYFIDGPSAAQDYEIRTDKAHSRGWGILVAVRATKSAAARRALPRAIVSRWFN